MCGRDWSSDVCSSDLWGVGGPGTPFKVLSPGEQAQEREKTKEFLAKQPGRAPDPPDTQDQPRTPQTSSPSVTKPEPSTLPFTMNKPAGSGISVDTNKPNTPAPPPSQAASAASITNTIRSQAPIKSTGMNESRLSSKSLENFLKEDFNGKKS